MRIVSYSFAREIAKFAGVRNRLMRQYEEIDAAIVHESIADALYRFKKYIQAIQDFLSTRDEKPNHETGN